MPLSLISLHYSLISLHFALGATSDALSPQSTVVCKERLSKLIELVFHQLSGPDRTKIITIITMDMHR